MKTNFFKITFRNLLRNKVYAAISILGLALGISACILISMYVVEELSYDDYHEKGDRVYRLSIVNNFQGQMVTALSNFAAGPTLVQDYPEVENYVRFRGLGSVINLSIDQEVFNEPNCWMVDSTIFDVFTFDVLAGDPSSALAAPRSIVLTQTLKQKLFGDRDALGEEIKINNSMFSVTAVIADPPSNSDITINAMLSMSSMPPQAIATFEQDWFRIGFYTFLLFNEPIEPAQFADKLIAFEEKYVQPWAAENQLEASQEYNLTALEDVHFVQGLDYDLPKGNMNYILIFSLLALFILIAASINYINLSLAQSTRRAKEVGVRKTLGALRKELMAQFIGESLIIAFVATIIGLALVELLMGSFNTITGKSFSILTIFSPDILLTLLGIVLIVGVLAGAYPALALSRFQPIRVLKGIIPNQGGVNSVQKSLILVQFIFSLFMITGTLLINEQMNFLRSKNLGFDKENVLVVSLPADTNVGNRVEPWVDELRRRSGIQAVAHTNVPTGNGTGELMFRVERDGLMEEQNIKFFFVDEYFVDVMGLDILEGRNFDSEIATDQQQAFIINQYAADRFGWSEDALGKRMQWGLMPNGQASNDGVVIGVVNDFHFLSLHKPMEPFVLCFSPSGNNMLTLRLAEGDFTATMSSLEQDWHSLAPNYPFNYDFLDDLIDQNYKQEKAMGDIFNYFAIISVLIAALGLFALLSYSIQGRIKEIGVRKVLGATVWQLSWILVKDFFILLLVAFIITSPVNIYLMHRWLEEFAYAVPLGPQSFVFALFAGLVLSGITVSYHIFKIAKADPVDALRYE